MSADPHVTGRPTFPTSQTTINRNPARPMHIQPLTPALTKMQLFHISYATISSQLISSPLHASITAPLPPSIDHKHTHTTSSDAPTAPTSPVHLHTLPLTLPPTPPCPQQQERSRFRTFHGLAFCFHAGRSCYRILPLLICMLISYLALPLKQSCVFRIRDPRYSAWLRRRQLCREACSVERASRGRRARYGILYGVRVEPAKCFLCRVAGPRRARWDAFRTYCSSEMGRCG